MLPTPVKTPRKKKIGNLDSTARVLFRNQSDAVDEIPSMPKRGRRAKRFNGFSLESIDDDDSTAEPQIFVDSKDKVPELDTSEDNPFYIGDRDREPTQGSTGLRSSKRRKVSDQGKTTNEVEEAINREDGMLYVL